MWNKLVIISLLFRFLTVISILVTFFKIFLFCSNYTFLAKPFGEDGPWIEIYIWMCLSKNLSN